MQHVEYLSLAILVTRDARARENTDTFNSVYVMLAESVYSVGAIDNYTRDGMPVG